VRAQPITEHICLCPVPSLVHTPNPDTSMVFALKMQPLRPVKKLLTDSKGSTRINKQNTAGSRRT
jgi:hypothetical protein